MSKPPLEAYKFCMICGGAFQNKNENLLQCEKCNHRFYINASPTASAIITNDQGEILLAIRGIEPKIGTWDVVGGFMSINETFEEALLREIKEELGVEGEFIEYLGSYPEQYEFSGICLPLINFVGLAKLKSNNLNPQDDVSEIKYVHPSQIQNTEFGFPSMKQAVLDYITKYPKRPTSK